MISTPHHLSTISACAVSVFCVLYSVLLFLEAKLQTHSVSVQADLAAILRYIPQLLHICGFPAAHTCAECCDRFPKVVCPCQTLPVRLSWSHGWHKQIS